MTDDVRAAAEVLARARAHVPAPARARAASSPSSPPEDEPKPGSPADIGHVHAPARAAAVPIPKKPDPTTALEDVGETGDPLFGPWRATVRRPDGRGRDFFGATALEARRKALAWIEQQGSPGTTR